MEKRPENRAVPKGENRVAMVALGNTKDYRGHNVRRGQSFNAANQAEADKLIAIGRAKNREPKLGKTDAKPSDKSNDTKKSERKSPKSGDT